MGKSMQKKKDDLMEPRLVKEKQKKDNNAVSGGSTPSPGSKTLRWKKNKSSRQRNLD